MSDKQGWIKLYRKIQDNPLWTEKRVFSRAEAWIDILIEVRHDEKPANVLIGSTLVVCNRGQCIKSLDTWALRWGWNKSAVRRFFELLQNMEQIRHESATKTTRLTVCNYDTYNQERNGSETKVKRKRNALDTHLTPNKNEENEENEKNEKNEDNSFALSGDAPTLPIDDLPPEEKKPRKRNPLFDAVGSADGDVDQLTKSAKGRVAKALQEITGALPSVTPEEIYRRIGNLKTYFDGTGVTSTSLAKNWAKCDNAKGQKERSLQPRTDVDPSLRIKGYGQAVTLESQYGGDDE